MFDGETLIRTRSSYCETVGKLHYVLKNGSDLHVNEHQKIRHYRARSTEEERMPNNNFLLHAVSYITLLW